MSRVCAQDCTSTTESTGSASEEGIVSFTCEESDKELNTISGTDATSDNIKCKVLLLTLIQAFIQNF